MGGRNVVGRGKEVQDWDEPGTVVGSVFERCGSLENRRAGDHLSTGAIWAVFLRLRGMGSRGVGAAAAALHRLRRWRNLGCEPCSDGTATTGRTCRHHEHQVKCQHLPHKQPKPWIPTSSPTVPHEQRQRQADRGTPNPLSDFPVWRGKPEGDPYWRRSEGQNLLGERIFNK